jgi:hypothetical protein
VGGQHLLNHGAHAREGQLRLVPASRFVLEKAVGDRRQDGVALLPRPAAAFEMIESELVLE